MARLPHCLCAPLHLSPNLPGPGLTAVWGVPPAPDPAGSPSGRRFPDSTAPGDAYQNRGVRAVPSPSTFLWERAGAGSCVNKQPLPQAAPLRGGGREGQGGQLGVWSWGGESLLQ